MTGTRDRTFWRTIVLRNAKRGLYFVGPDGERYLLGGDDYAEGDEIWVPLRVLQNLKLDE